MADDFKFDVSQEITEKAIHATRGLTSLTLYVEEGGSLSRSGHLDSELFAHAPMLQTLVLTFDDPFENPCHEISACFAASTNLRTLKLTGANGGFKKWFQMFGFFKHSLRSVRLVRATIVYSRDGECWSRILLWMTQHLELHSLELVGLLRETILDDIEYYCWDGEEVTANLKGTEEIRSQVEKICAKARYVCIDDNDGVGMGLYAEGDMELRGVEEFGVD